MFCSSHDLMKWHLHNSGPPGFYSASQKHFEHFGKFLNVEKNFSKFYGKVGIGMISWLLFHLI